MLSFLLSQRPRLERILLSWLRQRAVLASLDELEERLPDEAIEALDHWIGEAFVVALASTTPDQAPAVAYAYWERSLPMLGFVADLLLPAVPPGPNEPVNGPVILPEPLVGRLMAELEHVSPFCQRRLAAVFSAISSEQFDEEEPIALADLEAARPTVEPLMGTALGILVAGMFGGVRWAITDALASYLWDRFVAVDPGVAALLSYDEATANVDAFMTDHRIPVSVKYDLGEVAETLGASLALAVERDEEDGSWHLHVEASGSPTASAEQEEQFDKVLFKSVPTDSLQYVILTVSPVSHDRRPSTA